MALGVALGAFTSIETLLDGQPGSIHPGIAIGLIVWASFYKDGMRALLNFLKY